MRILIRSMCLMFAFMTTVFAADVKSSEAWVTDWSAFVKQLSVEVSKNENYYIDNVNGAFSGKKVQWEGKVTEIKRPEKTGDSGLIRLSMKPEKLAVTGWPTLDNLVIEPEEAEWESWKSVSVGNAVAFGTTLDEGPFVPKCVLAYMQGAGPNAGKTMAWINTKGGNCLKIVGEDKK